MISTKRSKVLLNLVLLTMIKENTVDQYKELTDVINRWIKETKNA
jgi:hypothetical protein